MMLTKFLTRVTTLTSSSAGATAIIESNQSTNEVEIPTQPTTVYHPHLHNSDEFIFVDTDNKNSTSSSLFQNIANSDLLIENDISPLNIGVTGSEFNCALSTLKEHPDLIYDLIPPNFLSPERTKKLYGAMHNVLSDPRVVSSVKSKLLSYDLKSSSQNYHLDNDDVKSSDGELTNSRSENSSTYAFNHRHLSPSEQWNELAFEHPCVICQDVLAKPTILSCSHSFCGSCLHELVTSCSDASHLYPYDIDEMIANMDVIKKCPTCKDEIRYGGIYERALDDVITTKASLIPECEGKVNWMERRMAHDVSGTPQGPKKTSTSTYHYGDESSIHADSAGNDDDDVFNWVIPALVMVILSLIAVLKFK